MVSLVVSSLLIGMILAIWGRMSLAFRGQQSLAELQQILAAAHERVESDLRLAGFQIPDGFLVAGDPLLHEPVEIVDDADGFGPDELRVFAADASAVARVVDFNGGGDAPTDSFVTVAVDTAADFVAGDLAVIVKAQAGAPADVAFFACVVQIESIAGDSLTLAGNGLWGTTQNDQCDRVRTDPALGPDRRAMVYRFRARAYRIDPARRDLAVLQMSPTAGRAGDWEDLAVGFTDLQVATRWSDGQWHSDDVQAVLTAPNSDPARPRPLVARVSLVVRTHTKVDVAPSQRTPALIDPANPANNDLGNRDAIQLEGVDDAARPEELRGEHVYRHATVGTDLRNLGVGL